MTTLALALAVLAFALVVVILTIRQRRELRSELDQLEVTLTANDDTSGKLQEINEQLNLLDRALRHLDDAPPSSAATAENVPRPRCCHLKPTDHDADSNEDER